MSDRSLDVIGDVHLVDGAGPGADPATGRGRRPGAALTAACIAAHAQSGVMRVVFSTSEARADELARALAAMAGPDTEVLVLPPWDCLPYDHASPSRDCQGRRLEVLSRLGRKEALSQILVVSPEAAMQRLPPQDAREARMILEPGQRLDREALEVFALQSGYVADDRVDEPGELAILGEVIDIFPASAPRPVRIGLDGDRIDSLREFDPISQRSEDALDAVTLRPASECLLGADEEREPGCEHRLGQTERLQSLFNLLAGAELLAESGFANRCLAFLERVEEAYETARAFGDGRVPPRPDNLYLTRGAAEKALAGVVAMTPGDQSAAGEIFALHRHPGRALKSGIERHRDAGRRIVITGLGAEMKMIERILKRQSVDLHSIATSWADILAGKPGQLFTFEMDLGGGFDAPDLSLTVIAASDVLGGRIAQGRVAASVIGEPDLRPGDVVIHEDHGLGVLEALERIEVDGFERDVIRLGYAGGATVLAPVEEFARLWRYGSEPAAVTLDRPGADAWPRRRAQVSLQIDQAAARLVDLAARRDAVKLAPLTAPAQAYGRFAARFPFPESADQTSAIDAVLQDLASGRPMNRLVCGDVGFGKTEVALRAAAAAALAGRQVAVVCPTTVLARQHFETFRRRFRDTGLQVGHLSRLVDRAEAAAVKAGLADGTLRIVVGTQSLAAEAVEFADLALVIIDEEQRFGTRLKEDLRAKADHGLAMTATPIPRTLQGALVGLLDVSVIASPPSRRRPVRTTLAELSEASLRTALLREKRRGGQTFVVCPRIEDLDPMSERLTRLVPELSVRIVHGRMPAAEVDAVMVDFADGRGDILLATNIIESGLDVPRANTIIVWRPDRFGLAQLHQLRGRVGRGRAQGFAFLLSDPEQDVGEGARARLATLEAFDRLGAGFAISARDLDLRGGGDLVGEDQAGHMKIIGASLYQHVLERAVRQARGEPPVEPLPPLRVDPQACLPLDYIPDATMRINIYKRLSEVTSVAEVEALEDEISDRFGRLPAPVAGLLNATRLSALAADAGVTRITSGPKATAFTVCASRLATMRKLMPDNDARRWVDDRLVFEAGPQGAHDETFIAAVLSDLAA